jgi:hypothetical protein
MPLLQIDIFTQNKTGNTNWRGKLNAVDLLIKVAGFEKR